MSSQILRCFSCALFCGGLAAVRDGLNIAFAENLIDGVEFPVLYDANRAKQSFPYCKYDEFNFNNWDDAECRTELMFAKNDLDALLDSLQIPDQIAPQQGTVCNSIEGLCILLRRLSYPCRYIDMVPRFGRNPTELCLLFNAILDHVYASYHHRLESWDQPFLQPDRLLSTKKVHHLRIVLVLLTGLCEVSHDQRNTNASCTMGIKGYTG